MCDQMKGDCMVEGILLSTFSNIVKSISLFIGLNKEVNKTYLSITQIISWRQDVSGWDWREMVGVTACSH